MTRDALKEKSTSRVPWWKWPMTRGNNLAPWYVIAWRAIWWPGIVLSLIVFVAFVTTAYGVKKGADAWWMNW